MTSYEFEVAAKNALLKVLEDKYDLMLSITDLELVWFTHVVGSKKCMIYGNGMGILYAEVTFAKEHGKVYVDIYRKTSHDEFLPDELSFSPGK